MLSPDHKNFIFYRSTNGPFIPFLSVSSKISTFIIALTSRDLIIFRSSHSFAQINRAIYSQLLVMYFLNSAFCEKKSKYLNCFISCSFSWHVSFWSAFKNKLQNHNIFRYEKRDGEQWEH